MLRIPARTIGDLGFICLIASIAFSSSANAQPVWGTYLKPFAATSLWNCRPVAPILGEDFIIPADIYSPAVAEGAYSTGVFVSKADDKPVTVSGLPGTAGLWDPDAETYHNVTLPRWPSGVVPASGSDGHAVIVDPYRAMVHSFQKLKYQDNHWMAATYAWTPLAGTGWADPAHYFQGVRATGVSLIAGLIRKHEVADGDVMYRHALAMSLSASGLSTDPRYVLPATSSDGPPANFGRIPEGARVMLPANFNTQQITNSALRKVAQTLKVYGAYVVDRNVGTPYQIYVENGSGFSLHNGGWDNRVAYELDIIRQSLRPVVSASGWIDGNGKWFQPSFNYGLLSMRGASLLQSGGAPGVFDTWTQAVVFPATDSRSVQVNYSTRGINSVSWGKPVAGVHYRLTAVSSGGAGLHLKLYDTAAKAYIFDSGDLDNGESILFKWPIGNVALTLYTYSGVGTTSMVRGILTRSDD